MNWLQIDIDIALAFTFCIVVFSGLQWKAVEKQNDQTLFRLRIKHYQTFYKLCVDLIVRLEHNALEEIIDTDEIQDFERMVVELENYIDESKFLFSKELYNYERAFVDNAHEIYQKLYQNEPPSQAQIDNLNIAYKASKKLIEAFLNRSKP